jgi:hypothetical protein
MRDSDARSLDAPDAHRTRTATLYSHLAAEPATLKRLDVDLPPRPRKIFKISKHRRCGLQPSKF